MTSWPGCRMAPLDFESTGIDVFNDRIVTAYIGMVGGGEPTIGETSLINPGIPIPAGATAVHGVTDEMAAQGLKPAEALDTIAADLCLNMHRGVPVVGMNLVFDLSMLQAELARHELPTLTDRLSIDEWLCIDVSVIDKACWKFRTGSRKLTALASTYSIDLADASKESGAAHGAEVDALTAARIAWRVGQIATNPKVRAVFGFKPDVDAKFAALGAMSLRDLHSFQVKEAATQAASLKKYFASKGKKDEAASVSSSWPIRTMGG